MYCTIANVWNAHYNILQTDLPQFSARGLCSIVNSPYSLIYKHYVPPLPPPPEHPSTRTSAIRTRWQPAPIDFRDDFGFRERRSLNVSQTRDAYIPRGRRRAKSILIDIPAAFRFLIAYRKSNLFFDLEYANGLNFRSVTRNHIEFNHRRLYDYCHTLFCRQQFDSAVFSSYRFFFLA